MLDKKKHKALQDKYLLKQTDLVKALFYAINTKNTRLNEKVVNVTSEIKENLFSDKTCKAIFNLIKNNSTEESLSVSYISEKLEIDDVKLSLFLEEGVFYCTLKSLTEIYDDFIELYKCMYCCKILLDSYNEILETQKADSFEESVVYQASQLPRVISNKSDTKDVVQLGGELLDRINNATEQRFDICKTGLKTFDDRYYGLEPSRLYLVAARTSIGKSNIAMDWMHNIVFNQKKKAAFFSLEMDANSLYDRLVAKQANIPLTFIKTLKNKGYNMGNTNEQYHENYEKLGSSLSHMDEYKEKVFLMTRCFSLKSIHANAVMLKHRYDINAIFIDYVQLINTGDKEKKDIVGKAIRGLFLIAQELEVPVIVLSQVNREGEKAGASPTITNLSESDVLAQVPDMVIIIDKKREEENGLLKIAKARDGELSNINIHFDSKTLSFKESGIIY